MNNHCQAARRTRASARSERPAPAAGRGRARNRALLPALALALAVADAGLAAQNDPSNDPKPPPATQASLGYVGVDPGTVREMDIRTGRVLEPLPFDVQFFIQSPVDTKVEEVSGRYVQARDLLSGGRSCLDIFPLAEWEARGYLAPFVMVKLGDERIAVANGLDKRPEDTSLARVEDQQGSDRVEGQRDIAFIRFIDAVAGDPPVVEGRSVELSVPALRPNRDICFEFNLSRKVDQEAFRVLARTAVEAELQDPRWIRIVPVASSRTGETKRSTIQTPVAFNRLRRRLIDDLMRQRKRGERLSAPRGSFFDPHVNLAGVRANYRKRFVEIMGWQTDRFDVITAIEGTTREPGTRELLVISLRKLLTSDAYRALQQNGTLTKRTLGTEIIPRLTQDNFSQWADGRPAAPPNAAALDFDSFWQASSLEETTDTGVVTPGILDNLDQGQRDFSAFARVIEQLKANPDLAKLDGLQDEQLEELEEDVRTVREKLFFHINELRKLRDRLRQRDEALDDLVDQLALELDSKVRLLGTTTGNYETRASFYISADVGVGYAPDVEEMFTYFGTNIYFRPVNKKAPLRGLSFLKRFSLMIGLTNESLQSEGQLKGIVGTSPLLVAGGFRLNDFLRLSAGAVVFKDEDPNPLITEEQLSWSPYVSLSIDWNLRKIFARFGGALNLTEPPSAR